MNTIFISSLHKHSYKKQKSLKTNCFKAFLICKTKYIIKIKEEKRFLYIDINLDI